MEQKERRQTISVVMAVKNEAKNIRDCLENIKWADEIIIIDNFSTDKTIEIAKEYTDKIYTCDGGKYGFIPYLQNIGIEKATKDWILILDADVRVPEEAKEEILEKIKNPNYNGYLLTHINYFMGKPLKSNYWIFKVMKLFKNKRGKFVCDCAHSVIKISGQVGEIDYPLLHYAHPDIETFINKINLYSSQDALHIFKEKKGGWLNRPIQKINFYNLFIEPVLLFFYVFLLRKSFRDGMRGFIISVLLMFYLFLERAKVWELKYKNKKLNL